MWLQSKVTAAAQEGLAKQAKVMLEDLERSSANQVNIPARKRIMASLSWRFGQSALTIQNGDLAYRYMIDISLSSEVLGCPASDTRIQAAVKSVLELCSEMSRESSNLIWPLLTAGAYAVTASDRDWCSQLLTATALDRGSDIEVAVSLAHLLDSQMLIRRRRTSCMSSGRGWTAARRSRRGLLSCAIYDSKSA